MLKYSRKKYLVSAAVLTGIVVSLAIPCMAKGKLSPALDIISNEHTMAKSGIIGTDIEFSKEDFSESLGVSSIGKITIASIPESHLGRLQLGAHAVSVGQVISEGNLDALKFVPYGSDEITAKFTFHRGKGMGGPEYECAIYTLRTVNSTPTISTDTSAVTGDLTVYSGVTHLGSIKASDKENDPLTFEIVSDAAHGAVKLTDRARGYYEYTADANYSGRDSFTVRVTDKFGNRSDVRKISFKVSKPTDNEVFSDMGKHWANSAVITCVRQGIIDTATAGEKFYPDEYISRGEFLYLAMNAAGCGGFSGSYTGFADDADIPEKYKGCVALADTLGIINGVETDAGVKFYPNNQITRSEAAVILSRITGIDAGGEVAVFADENDIPAFAKSAMRALYAAGILRGVGEGRLDAYSPLTRGAAVQLVASAIMN